MPKIEFGDFEMAPVVEGDKARVEMEGNKQATQNCPEEELDSTTTTSDATISETEEAVDMEQASLLQSERSVRQTKIVGIKKIQLNTRSSARFMFIVELQWSDAKKTFICRDHDDFFRYHCWLLDNFKLEAGFDDKPRTIPYLPGKKWFRNNLELAEQRRPLIETYLNELVRMKSIADSFQAQAFFGSRPGDPEDQASVFSVLAALAESRPENQPQHHQSFYKGNIKGSHDNLTFKYDCDAKETDPDGK